MFRKYFPVFLVGAVAAFSFAACGKNKVDEECADCGSYGGGAVKCMVGLGAPQVFCASDQDLAAIQCTEGGGTWVPFPLCPVEIDETESDSGNAPWQPGRDITFDSATGEYVVAQFTFEELKLDPAPLLGDSSQLRELDSGYYGVAVTGELSDALGWQAGDVLLAVDGHDLGGLAEFAAAYTALADNLKFELTIQRGRDEVVLRYRVE